MAPGELGLGYNSRPGVSELFRVRGPDLLCFAAKRTEHLHMQDTAQSPIIPVNTRTSGRSPTIPCQAGCAQDIHVVIQMDCDLS